MAAKVKIYKTILNFTKALWLSMSFHGANSSSSIHALNCVTQKGRKPNQKQTKKQRNTASAEGWDME